MTARIQLSNQVLTIGISEEDSARREAFFSANVGELTTDEKNVLQALGMRVGDAMYDSLRPHLSKFFNALPACQTDTDVYLKQDCEVPYYVLWSILFSNYQETERRLSEQQKRAELPTNLALAQSAFVAKDLGLPPAAPAPAPAPAYLSDFKSTFQLRFHRVGVANS